MWERGWETAHLRGIRREDSEIPLALPEPPTEMGGRERLNRDRGSQSGGSRGPTEEYDRLPSG